MLEQIVKDYTSNLHMKEIPNINLSNILDLERNCVKEYQKNFELSPLYAKYKIIDLSFLQKQKDGFPLFAVFNTKANCYFTLNFRYNSNSEISFNIATNFISKIVKKQFLWLYEKVIDENIKKIISNDESKITIKSEFCGILEDKHRELLLNEEGKFDEVILVAEAVNWTYEKNSVKYPPNPDPLIIGIKHNIAFLLEKFDLTNQEYYISKEFIV